MLSILSCFVYPLGKESLQFAVHPKRDKLLCIYTDIHPNTIITQYVICNTVTFTSSICDKKPTYMVHTISKLLLLSESVQRIGYPANFQLINE